MESLSDEEAVSGLKAGPLQGLADFSGSAESDAAGPGTAQEARGVIIRFRSVSTVMQRGAVLRAAFNCAEKERAGFWPALVVLAQSLRDAHHVVVSEVAAQLLVSGFADSLELFSVDDVDDAFALVL